jgi:transposase
LAKNVFHLHGVTAAGAVVFRLKLRRKQVSAFMASQPPCRVAMEACATAHWWARQFEEMGHSVRLIAPAYVKPFVKRQKNDTADAEAIAEAAMRPTMRFVAIKTTAQQERAMIFRTRDMLVRQRTQTINALRAHLAEHGIVAPAGAANVKRLAAIVDDDTAEIPELVREIAQLYLTQIAEQASRIAGLETRLRGLARESRELARLQTMPGVGPITAVAIESFAPDLRSFRCGRDFSAWLGLVPRQNSTGGKPRLGRISKMGQRDIRRLLISGAMSVVQWAARRGADEKSWLGRMLARKPKTLVAIALANRMARGLWAMVNRQEDFRVSAA